MVTNSALDNYPISDLALENGGQSIDAAALNGPYFWSSTDGGTTWTQVQTTSGANIGGMAVSPQNPSTIYLSDIGVGILKSIDGGATWTLLGSSPVIANGTATGTLHSPIEVDPTHTGTVYYGTDHGLYISSDGGSTWVASMNGIASGDSAIRDVAVAPAAPSDIFLLAGFPKSAVVDLYESTNEGISWTPLAVGLDAERVVPDPSSATTVYLYGLQCHAAYKSIDGGKTFTPSDAGTPSAGGSCNGSPAIILSQPTGTMIPLASSPSSYLLTYLGSGIYRTQDAAQVWSFSSTGLSAFWGVAVTVDPTIPTTVYLVAANAGLFRSLDNGTTWTQLFAGNSLNGVAVDPFDSTHLMTYGLNEGLNESHDGGVTWANRDSALPPLAAGSTFVDIYGANFHPKQRGTIFISTRFGGVGLVRSTDGGVTYTTVNSGLPYTNIGASVVFDPNNPNILLTTVDNNGTSENLAKSTDGGTTWAATPSNVWWPFSLDARSNPAVIYAEEVNSSSQGVGAKSADFGTSWTALGISDMPVADPNVANSVFTTTSWSPDGGVTWTPVFTNSLGMDPYSPSSALVAAPGSPQYLFWPSRTKGLLRLVVGP